MSRPAPWAFYAYVLVGALGFAMLVGSCIGPCSWLVWMPMKDVPARCLKGLVSP